MSYIPETQNKSLLYISHFYGKKQISQEKKIA